MTLLKLHCGKMKKKCLQPELLSDLNGLIMPPPQGSLCICCLFTKRPSSLAMNIAQRLCSRVSGLAPHKCFPPALAERRCGDNMSLRCRCTYPTTRVRPLLLCFNKNDNMRWCDCSRHESTQRSPAYNHVVSTWVGTNPFGHAGLQVRN